MAFLDQLIGANEKNLGRPLTDEEKEQVGLLARQGGKKLEDDFETLQGGGPAQNQFDEQGNLIAAQGHAAGAKRQNDAGTGRSLLTKFKGSGGPGDATRQGGSGELPEEIQQQKRKVAQAFGRSSKKLQLRQDDSGVRALAEGLREGRPTDPHGLIGERRNKLRGQIESTIQGFKFDNSQELQEEFTIKRVKSKRDKKLGLSGTLQKVKKELGPKAQALRDAKLGLFKSRIANIRQQIVELDGVENKLTIANNLENDDDYQDAIKSLLTGQNIPTTLDRQKADDDKLIELKKLEAKGTLTTKQALDLQNRQRELDIKQQVATTGQGKLSLDIEKAIGDVKKNDKLDDKTKKEINTRLLGLNTAHGDIITAIERFNPDDFTVNKQTWADLGNLAGRLGIDISEDWRTDIKDVQSSNTRLGLMFASYMKMISGAAVSDKEKERLAKSYLNPDMGPDRAEQSMRDLLALTIKDRIALSTMASEGLDITDEHLVNSARSSVSLSDPRVQEELRRLEPKLREAFSRDKKNRRGRGSGTKFTPGPKNKFQGSKGPTHIGRAAAAQILAERGK